MQVCYRHLGRPERWSIGLIEPFSAAVDPAARGEAKVCGVLVDTTGLLGELGKRQHHRFGGLLTGALLSY